jgi:hypothetical protein
MERNKTYKAKAIHDLKCYIIKELLDKLKPLGPNGTLLLTKDVEHELHELSNTSYYSLRFKEQKENEKLADKYLKRL